MSSNPTLFPLPGRTAPTRRAQLHAFMRKHGILSHRANFMAREQHPWLAILPMREDRGKDIGTIMSESCRLYDESPYLATGAGEYTTVRTLCEQAGVPFTP